MCYTCQYCGRIFEHSHSSFMYHVNRCSKNPNRVFNGHSYNTKFFSKNEIILHLNKTKFKLFKSLENKQYRTNDKIDLICVEHGMFSASVGNIINDKVKCKKCSFEQRGKERRVSPKQWLKKFKEKHGNKYDYSKSDFEHLNENGGKILIICPEHGEFWMSPRNHAGGQKCMKCYHNVWDSSKESKNTFIKLANECYESKIKYIDDVHNYSYRKLKIKNYNTPIIVTCKLHGDFITSIKGFLGGHGCKKCSSLNRNASHTFSTEQWITRLQEIYIGYDYDYSKVSAEDVKNKHKVTIFCRTHNKEFQTNPLKANRCPCCATNTHIGKLHRLNEKLLLLTKYDLEGMDWAVIMDLIGEDKLPKEFYCLCKFGPNTEGRRQQIEKLKEFYNVESDELEDTANEIIEQTVSNIDDETYSDNSDENELKTYEEIDTLADILKIEEKEIYSTGDKYIHIFEKEISKLWGLVLRDNESHSTKNLEFISKKLNDKNITPFAKHIYEEFMKEYEKVISFEAA